MIIRDDDSGRHRSNVSCGNCGRTYGPDDGIRFFHYSCASILGLKGLFTGRLRSTACPNSNCGYPLDFVPGVFMIGLDPPVAYFHGGDALSASQLDDVVQRTREESSAKGMTVEIRTFNSQDDLAEELLKRLKSKAKAMMPLNAANVKGELDAFLVAHWRTITPEVFVASDVLTMLEHAPRGDEGLAYFARHAESLGHIQAKGWIVLCCERGWNSSALSSSFKEDLDKYVDADVIFQTAAEEFEQSVKRYMSQKDKRDSLIGYCMLALLARIRKARKQENALSDEWTAAWMGLELALRDKDEQLVRRLEPLVLSADALSGTLRRQALFDVAVRTLQPCMVEERFDELKRLGRAIDEIAEKAGYPELGSEVQKRGIVLKVEGIGTPQQAIDFLDAVMVNFASDDELPKGKLSPRSTMDSICRDMIARSDVGGVTAVFRRAVLNSRSLVVRGELEWWYGAALLRMHHERMFLDEVGDLERDWEGNLPDGVKGGLWTERGNALRAAGRLDEALQWRRRVVPLYADRPGSSNHRQAIRGLATAERETGAPDRALELILPLLEDKEAFDRIDMLDTASAVWSVLGERTKASAAIQEAVRLAVGPNAHRRQHFETMLATMRNDASDAAIEGALLAGSRDAWGSPLTLLNECVGWLRLQLGSHELSAEGESRCSDAFAALGQLLSSGSIPPFLREPACIAFAELGELYGIEDVHLAWRSAADAADALGRVPQPQVVIALASFHYQSGAFADARAVLRALPLSLARNVQRLERLDIALESMTNLKGRLDTLTSRLVADELLGDARAVAEFRRDVLRRVASRANIEEDSAGFLGGRMFAPVLSGSNAVVIEFLSLDRGIQPMITWQPPGNLPQTQLLGAADIDVFELRERIVNKLQGWGRGRSGNPLDVKHWSEFCLWLRESIGRVVPEPGHLVVIETDGLEGIPFHVAVAPEWTCSYASSWTSLAAAMAPGSKAPATLGYAMVPALSDDLRVTTAMQDVRSSLGGLANRVGISYEECVGAACDESALSELLRRSDVGFIACHGFLDEEEKEVAWVLAHDGGLPTRAGVLVSKEEVGINRFSWHEIERLEITPRLVVSAACSSGRALTAGLGDRIGLYQSLSRRGTRTLIAPAWDVEADLFMPIAAHALQLHVERGMTVAAAVREACMTAGAELPVSCAWALSIEGAWK